MSDHEPPNPEKFSDDLLIGAAAIAEFIYGAPDARRSVFHLAASTQAPIGKLGSRLVARKSDLIDYLKPPRKPPGKPPNRGK